MNHSSTNTALCKIQNFFEELSKIQLKSDYHIKLSLFRDEKSENPSCSHSINGASKCRLMKMVAVLSVVVLITSIMHDIFYCARFKK